MSSITGQVGHVGFAKQSAYGTPNSTAAQYKAVKITGDSLVASNNMLVAENEIGTGRDVSSAIPGGFSSAGAVNGNLRVRAASIMLQGALGARTEVAGVVGPPATVDRDTFAPADTLPVWTVEKKIGTSGSKLLVLQYTDTMINTLNISIPTGGFSTFSAGLIAAGENEQASALTVETYPATGDGTLAWHGGRIRVADTGTTLVAANDDTSFQNVEVSINNNVLSDEYTIRPSRYLRGLTEGIRAVEANMTIVFDDKSKYEKYTYGATGSTSPGYSLYHGVLEVFLGNWQIIDTEDITTAAPTGAPANPQAMDLTLYDLAFAGFPVQLTSGRIVVQTNARALKTPGVTNIVDAVVRPQRAGLDYA